MSAEITAYKEFVDGLVNYRGSVSYIVEAFRERRWEHPSALILNELPDELRELVLSVIKKVAETAVHDVLVQITDKGYCLKRGEVTLADRPFEMALYDDFIARVDGLPWPDEE